MPTYIAKDVEVTMSNHLQLQDVRRERIEFLKNKLTFRNEDTEAEVCGYDKYIQKGRTIATYLHLLGCYCQVLILDHRQSLVGYQPERTAAG